MSIAFINVAYQDGTFAFNRANPPKFKNVVLEEIIFDDTTNFDSLMQSIDFNSFDAYMLPISYELFDLDFQMIKLFFEYKENAQIYFVIKDRKVRNSFCFQYDGHKIICVNERESTIDSSKTEIDFDDFSKMFTPSSENQSYSQIMQNGYTAFVTGVYPENTDNEKAKHIYVSSMNNSSGLDFKKLCDLNAAVFYEDNYAHRKFGLESYVHHHRLGMDQVVFDDGRAVFESKILPYSTYQQDRKTLQSHNNCKYFLSIENLGDLSAFEKDIDDFVMNNQIHSWNSSLVDECRWTNGCTLKNLYRYSVLSTGEIQPCLTCKTTIAKISDNHYTKLINAGERYDETLIDRNCDKCPKHQFCSKCSLLPQGIPSDEYCRIMDKYMQIVEYIYKRDMLRALKRSSNLFSQANEISISCCINPLVFPREYITIKANKVELAKFGLLFLIGKQYIVFCYNNKELAEIDIRLAFIMEGYCSAVPEDKIAEAYVKHFNVSIEEAKTMVSRGLSFLKEAAVVY